MVPEIWSEADKHFCNVGPFFALLSPPPSPYSPNPPNDSKYQNFEKKNERNACRYYPSIHTYIP